MCTGVHAWALGLGLLAGPALAQEEAERTHGPPILLEQVTPEYPEDATGTADVVVNVTVGVDGSVLQATPASGPAAFVPAALNAARQLVFEPAMHGGQPIETTIPVHFHFAPHEDEHIDDAVYEIVVETEAAGSTETHAVAVLDEEDLARAAGEDLAQTVSQVPGVTAARGTADSTKPIIRGQVERRLLVMYDGVRHESQKWGSDHATEIDPFAAGHIHVVKGAAGVRYGPDAIGGVLLVEPRPLRYAPGVEGAAQLIGLSNGRRGVASVRLDTVPAAVKDLAVRVEANYGRGAAISAPDYVLGNTASEQWNLGLTTRYIHDSSTWTLSWHHYDLRAGVCYCASHHSLEDLQGALDANRPVGAQRWTTDYTIDRPFQTVTHDIALARSVVGLPAATLTTTYAFQINHRREYEQVRESVDGPQYDFILRTHSVDAEWAHTPRVIREGLDLEGGVGLTSAFQENVYAGLPLIPNHRSFTGGVFGYERLNTPKGAVDLGARYDHQSRTSFLTDSAFDRHRDRGTLSPRDCEISNDVAHCPLSFDTGSVSLGGLWRAVEDRVELKLDLSSASRFPNGDELYMNGSAPTSPVYALGDPSLGVETTWGASPTIGFRFPWLEAEASVYGNLIDDYIYFAPAIGDDGEPAYDITIRGAYPRFTFQAVDAVFYGTDGGLSLGPELPVGVELSGAIVRGQERSTGEGLIGVPPDRAQATVIVRPPDTGSMRDSFVEVSGVLVGAQTRVDPQADLAPPPDAYALLHAAIGTNVGFRGDRVLRLGVEGTNLTNSTYREYTSLLRYFADEPGRSFRLRIGFDF